MQLSLHQSINELDRDRWQAWNTDSNPFLNWHFYESLEKGDCLQPFGWSPAYLQVIADGSPIAYAPTFVKHNTFGEFVFDGVWAEAYERNGIEYYPKLTCAAPYSPATGARILGEQTALLQTALSQYCQELGLNSAHILFEADPHSETHWHLRHDIQFQWFNRDYADFEGFLSALTSKKRKNVRQERRRVRDQGFDFLWVNGREVSTEDLHLAHALYAAIYDRKWGYPALSVAFFENIRQTMGEQFWVCFACQDGEKVAMSMFFQSAEVLYGRYWGCKTQHDALHFETCYYQGIEHAIAHGLKRFEPGAQGEHKLARGFEPTLVRSKHFFADAGFANAIGDYLARERHHVALRLEDYQAHSPFRGDSAC